MVHEKCVTDAMSAGSSTSALRGRMTDVSARSQPFFCSISAETFNAAKNVAIVVSLGPQA